MIDGAGIGKTDENMKRKDITGISKQPRPLRRYKAL